MRTFHITLHQRILLLILIPAVSMVISCKRLIEIPPNAPGQIVTAQVFADSADAEAAVVQLYTNYSYVVLSMKAGGFTVYPALSADELRNTAADQLLTTCYNNNFLSSNSNLTSWWLSFYNSSSGGIYQANACIEGIKASVGISVAEKDQLIGEAEMMRAFLYFQMVNWFGGVPLVTTTNYELNAALPRASDTAVYDQVIADLKDARTRLKPGYPSAGRARANLYTAKALLAKVFLYRKDWKNAAAEASDIISSGSYSLVTDPDNVFLQGSNEAILQLPSIYPTVQTTEGTVFVPKSPNTIPAFVITSSLLSAFEPGDQRFDKWVNTAAVTAGGVTTNYYYPYKYKKGASPEDYVIFRLAEQYLIRAEAASQMNDQPGAIADLDIIRARAGLSGYQGPQTASDVQDAIQHERQVELFCEFGNRWADLKRTGRVNAVMAAAKPSTWPADGHAVLYPIPITEIQKNGALQQNTGY